MLLFFFVICFAGAAGDIRNRFFDSSENVSWFQKVFGQSFDVAVVFEDFLHNKCANDWYYCQKQQSFRGLGQFHLLQQEREYHTIFAQLGLN